MLWHRRSRGTLPATAPTPLSPVIHSRRRALLMRLARCCDGEKAGASEQEMSAVPADRRG